MVYSVVKVAAVQATSVFLDLDREGSTEKPCRLGGFGPDALLPSAEPAKDDDDRGA